MAELSPEELALARKLGLVLHIDRRTLIAAAPTAYKIVHTFTTCNLCKTITEQFIKMQKIDNVWGRLEDLKKEDVEDVRKLEIQRTVALTCWNCETVLTQKDKPELIKMIIDIAVPKLSENETKPRPRRREKRYERIDTE